MANLTLAISASVEIDGETFSMDFEEVFTMTAPEKAYHEIVTTSTTVTDIDIGTEITWSTIELLCLKNLSTTAGEHIDIYKGATWVARLEPGRAFTFFPPQDGTAYRWDAAAGTPRLAVLAYGPMTGP